MTGNSWHVPFPAASEEHDGKKIYWKYFHTVQEDGIGIYAEQFMVIRETNHYVWVVPAFWYFTYGFKPENWYEQWRNGERHGIRKIAKNAERSFAHSSRELALASLLRRKKYHLMRLKQDLAVVTTVVQEVSKLDKSAPLDYYNFGHNAETESWMFE